MPKSIISVAGIFWLILLIVEAGTMGIGIHWKITLKWAPYKPYKGNLIVAFFHYSPFNRVNRKAWVSKAHTKIHAKRKYSSTMLCRYAGFSVMPPAIKYKHFPAPHNAPVQNIMYDIKYFFIMKL